MQTEAVGSAKLSVVAGDVLALRGAGLAASETWALLCQAAQALQDLFLSNGGVVGGSGVGPVVTPHTLELTQRGRVTLQLAPPETARAYLPPEYRLGRVYSDTDSEKMWMYSLGRALLDTTPRVAALTGSVSVSPSSALQSVLSAMTEPDPRRRASLMNLLDVISEYCRTRLQSKPFTHIVMDMYREVVRSPQYVARKRAAFPNPRAMPATQRHHQHQNQHQAPPQQQNQHLQHQKQQQPHQQHQQQQQHQHTGHFSKHQVKGALFKAQSRNSRSHPNLISLSAQEPSLSSPKPQFQSQVNIQTDNIQQPTIHHTRTSSQPEYSDRVQRGITEHTRSTHNLNMFTNGQRVPQAPGANVYSDPIYALPVKPFLSSQDVRVNGLSAKSSIQKGDLYGHNVGRPRIVKNGGSSQPNIAHLTRGLNGEVQVGNVGDIRGQEAMRNGQTVTGQALHRQYSNPQLPTRNAQESTRELRHYPQSNGSGLTTRLRVFTGDNQTIDGHQNSTQMNPVSSIKVQGLHGPVPPKPPRLITSLKRSVVPLAETNNGLSESVAPVKPPRAAIKNGPRARRGKPVQRAPSRLYRAIGGPTRCFNKTQCVGPEFVVRANQPPKILCVGDAKASSSGRIVVILLTGQRIEVTCDPQKITAGELFQAIVQAKSLEENFTLGLAALLAGDFAMLPPETKLNKVAPPGWLNSAKSKGTLGLPTSFMLYLRFRFFLPSLRGIRSWISKHLLYLQIRRCILEQQLVCPLAQLVNLTGLALQAEFGNYSVNEHGRGDYFLLEHYIPESLILNPDLQLQQSSQLPGAAEALRAKLHQAHRDRRGLDANNAEEMFITHAQALPDYGSHYYIATVDNKELEKIVARLNKCNANCSPSRTNDAGLYACTENIYQLDASTDDPIYGKIDFNHDSCDNIQRNVYTDEQKIQVMSKVSNASEDIYAVPISPSAINLVEANNNSNSSNNNNKLNKSKKSESNVWLAIHAQGLKLFDRGGRPRDRTELVRLQWRDIQTLSYSKNSLVVYTRLNGKRCKFKLRMDHKKSFYAFKLTSLHHQFFLKLRSEIASLHELAKDFGTPVIVDANLLPSKPKLDISKSKITLASCVRSPSNSKYPMQLEEYQNKENENPQKIISPLQKCEDTDTEPVCYTPEEDALYAQVNARLEPEGASRDTEDESDRPLASRNGHSVEISQDQIISEENKLHSYPGLGLPCDKESLYSVPKSRTSNDIERLNGEVKHPEELYAAINKSSQNNKNNEYSMPEETWDVANSKKNLHKEKTSSLPNYGTPRQSTGFRTPSLPRRLGVKMGTRAIYSSLVQRDSNVADDLTSLSLKSDTASSMQSVSVQSTESPMPEAYVLNEDIQTDDETFRVGNDVTMSASLAARLEELSFAEERILQTIQLERGHGGSIGLQVTEGNDGGVYVQAVSVGGSADMAGNVNKGDRIVAINGQSLLNLRYEESLKLLQSSPETVELVLSQITSNRHGNLRRYQLQEPIDSSYLQNLRFEIASEVDTSNMTTKWLSHGATDVASVQNTSSAYSSAASSAMGNHNTNNMYLTEVADTNAFNSAMEIGAPPPVPPRRRKHKSVIPPTKPSVAPRNNKKGYQSIVKVPGSRPDRKPRSLPPPPPPPSVSRERKPQSTKNTNPPTVVNDNSKSDSAKLKSCNTSLNFKSPTEGFIDTTNNQHFDVGQMITKYEPPKICIADESDQHCADQSLEYRNENRSGRSSPMPSQNPPLLFTYQDFESVMRHSGMSDRTVNEQYDSIVTPDTSGPTSISSFVENSMMNEEEEDGQACFRVTTTNVPFEKCVGSFTFSIDNTDFDEKFDEPDHYIFEDYMDRSKRWNARPTCLFDDDTFDNFGRGDGSGSIRRTATKVRFVIESPSSSTPDPDFDNSCDSLGNIESLIIDDRTINESHRTSVIITEITETNQPSEGNDNFPESPKSDQFGDVPFSSILDGEINNFRNLDSDQNVNVDVTTFSEQVQVICNNKEEAADYAEAKTDKWSESMERRNNENHQNMRSIHTPRFMSPKKPNIDAIPNIEEDLMPELPITYDPRDEGFVRKYWDVNSDFFNDEVIPVNVSLNDNNFETHPPSQAESHCRTSSEITKAARKAFVDGKLKADSNENQNINSPIKEDLKNAEVADKTKPGMKKIFIDSALRDFIDNDDDLEWNDSSDDEEDKAKLSIESANDNDLKCKENATSLLNRDKNLLQEVPVYPKSLTTNGNENNNEKAPNKEDFKTGSELTGCSRQQNLINNLTLSTESKDDMNWVPVSVRRNSFLENMLTEDKTEGSLERNVPCSIIAAHPKPMLLPRAPAVPSSVPNISREVVVEGTSVFRNVDKSSSDAGTIELVRSGSNELSQNQLGNGTGVKVVGSKPASRERIASRSEIEKKSTGEAKSDVLSELLCNFGAIKLKSVEPYKREIDWAVADDKPAIEKEIGDKREKEEEQEEEEEVVASVGRNKTGDVPRLEMSCNQTKVEGTVADARDSRSTQVSMTKTSTAVTKTSTTAAKTSTTTMTNSPGIEDSSLKDSANRAGEKTDHHTSLQRIDDKSAILTIECPEDRERLRRNDNGANSIILDTSIMKADDQQVVSVDKCAIARKNNSSTRCNNNDNNAMTPVDVSNDQKSCETDVTITPGSVRSFVELYEIQRDQTSKNSKSNYSDPVAKRSTSRCSKGLANNAGGDNYNQVSLGDKNVKILKGTYGDENGPYETETKAVNQIKAQRTCADRSDQAENDDVTYNVITRHVVLNGKANYGLLSTNDSTYVQNRHQLSSSSGPVAAKRRSLESCLNITTANSPRSESKKSVTFYSNCEVIKSDYDEGARPKTKRRAPERPLRSEERDCATKSIIDADFDGKSTPSRFITAGDTMNPTPTPRSDASLIRTQIQPGVEDNAKDTIKSGIASSVPKSDVSHPRQPYVFLCRV